MRNIFAEIERTNRAIWLCSILCATYNILRLISIIAAPYSIEQIVNLDDEISILQYQMNFKNYITEESQRLQIPAGSLKKTILYSGFVAVGYIIFSLLLGLRKKFAKYAIVSLALVEIIIDIIFGLKYSILPSKISIFVAITLLLFLFSHNISKEFK
jgi:hypothetical protein